MKTIKLFQIMLLTTIVTTTQVCGNVVIELPKLDRTWRPGAEPTLTKQDHTNTASFALKIKNLPYDYNKIDIKLIDVTKWQGICGNYPLSGAKKDKDLKFIKSKNTTWKYENDSHLFYKTSTQSHEKTVEGTVNVTAYDYAAYGKLEVSVRTRTWKVGPFEGYADPLITKAVTIPLDENGNKIADGWNGDENREHVINGVTKKGWNPSADDENVLNTNNGDGYSVFDEYRGFWTGTNHIELSPTAKDAIICPEDGDRDINTTTTRDMWWYEEGAASAIPSHSFHIIHQTYVKDPFRYNKVFYDDGTMRASVNANNGWVNVNSKKIPGYKQAWAIRIGKRTFDPTERPTLKVNGVEIYETLGNAAVGPPSQHSLIRIFYSAIRGYVYYKKRTFDTGIIDALTKKTIAHEIGHTVHLKHCSVPWSKTNNCIMQQQSSNVTDVKTAFGGHADGSHEIDYALTGNPPPPTAPHPTQGEGSKDEVTVDLSPNCNSCTTGGCPQCPTTGACGHTYTQSEASNHAYGTFPCGISTHMGYLCTAAAASDALNHTLQASCSITNANGDSCTVTNFYDCGQHTHVYPVPVIICARRPCDDVVSRAREHWVTCSAGHEHWSCHPWHENHHRVRTCRRTNCGQTWQRCSRPSNDRTPDCLASPGNKCAAIQ